MLIYVSCVVAEVYVSAWFSSSKYFPRWV